MHSNAALALVAAVMAFLAGCASNPDMTPTRQWVIASDSLNAVRNATVDLHDAGIVSKDDIQAMDPAEKIARKAINVAQTTLPEGGFTFNEWMLVFNEAMKTLAAKYAEKAGAK